MRFRPSRAGRLAGLALATAALGARADAGVVVPFGQQLDMALVRRVVQAPPDRLVPTLLELGLQLRRVARNDPARVPNPHLQGLPMADGELLRAAEFQDSYEGRLVCSRPDGCPLGRDTILIRETASDYTLLHEFVQSLLSPVSRSEPDDAVEARFAAAFRRLTVYQRRLFDDPYRLLDPRWRRDIAAAQLDAARDLYARIRLGQSQEAIVERLLALLIREGSPYHDAARREQGRLYGERMVNNAIDLFNLVQASNAFVREAVANLLAAARGGELEPGPGEAIDEGDVAAAARHAETVEALLQPVRAELEVLKRFYAP